MSNPTEQRKLAAIIPLCGTDMTGYNALAQRMSFVLTHPLAGTQIDIKTSRTLGCEA